MGLGCGMSMIKYILFVFNFLCALCGIALVSIGAVILAKLDDFKKPFEDHNVHAPPLVFIALGAVVFIIAFFGCCGAVRESYCMTTTYGFLMMTLIVLQIIVAVFIFLYIGDVTKATQIVLEKVFQEKSNPGNQEVIDVIQRQLECCGLKTPLSPLQIFDQSCCPTSELPCTYLTVFKQGCSDAIAHFIDMMGKTLGYVAIGVAGVQLVAVIFSCCLANEIRNQDRRYA